MKFFITDETNVSKDDKLQFFIYGGLIVDENDLGLLSRKILAIKQGFNVKKERAVKWNNANWHNEGMLDSETHAKLKETVLKTVARSNAKIVVYLSPHDFYHESSLFDLLRRTNFNKEKYMRSQEYAINACLAKFDKYLKESGSKGMVLADMFQDEYKAGLAKHCFALYPNGIDVPLENIIYPVMQVADEYSQIHQVNDIVLGAISYSLRELSKNFLPVIRDNFWRGARSGEVTIMDFGINIYPKKETPNQILNDKIAKVKAKFNRLLKAQ